MKYFFVPVIMFLFAACKGGAGKTGDVSKDTTQHIVNAGGTNIDSANETGPRLIAANDCLTCHQVDKKNVGPSYREVANRYSSNEGNIETLAHKIITGGKGAWGEVTMTAHPQLSQPQAREMVSYILSLRDSAQ